jgi:hypothetical protein
MVHGTTHPYDPGVRLQPENYKQMMRNYEALRREYHMEARLISGGEYVGQSIINFASVYAGGAAPLMVALGGQLLGDGLAYQADKARGEIYAEMTQHLDQALKETILSESRSHLENLTGQPRNKARQLITRHAQIFNFEHPPGVSEDEKNLFQETAIQVLADKLASESFEADIRQLEISATQEGLEEVRKQRSKHSRLLKGHIQNYTRFKTTVTENLATIAKSTKKILDQVNANTTDISVNKIQISNLQSSLFKKMSGTEKVQALKEGWFPQLGSKERRQQINLAQNEADIENAILNIQVASNNLPSAMSLFTSDPKTLEDVNRVSQMASGVVAVIQASSMGPFAAVMTGLGVMGGMFAKKDNGAADAHQHKQVMETFQKVIDNQIQLSEQIDKVQRSLAEGQQQIYSLMHEAAIELVRLGRKIDNYHVAEMKVLGLTKDFTLANMDLLRDIAEGDPNKCLMFFQTKIGQSTNVRLIDQFDSYTRLKEHFNSHRDLFKPCNLGLNSILSKHMHGDDIHSLLLAQSYSDHSNAEQFHWASRQIYEPALRFYLANKKATDPEAYPELIHAEAVKHYVSLSLEIYPYLLILDDPQAPSIITSLENHQINEFTFLRVKNLLEGGLRVVEEAILQQEIIAGHGWLEPLTDKVFKLPRSEQDEALRNLIEANPILQSNLSTAIVARRAEETQSPLAYYDSLLSGQEAYPFFTKFFGNRFLPEYTQGQWRINLGWDNTQGSLTLDMPDTETLIHREWSYTADLLTLHELRSQLIDHLALLSIL